MLLPARACPIPSACVDGYAQESLLERSALSDATDAPSSGFRKLEPLKDSCGGVGIELDDENGIAAYRNAVITPWLRFTGDVQYINAAPACKATVYLDPPARRKVF